MKDYAERLRQLTFPDITSQVVILATAKYIEDMEERLIDLANKLSCSESFKEAWEGLAQGKQAHIDELMLEYCPDQMTEEQINEWAKHQVPSYFVGYDEGTFDENSTFEIVKNNP
jgi:hypothetical protein